MERGGNENDNKFIITTTSTTSVERKLSSFPKSCAKLDTSFGNNTGADIIPNQSGEWSAFCGYMQKQVRFNDTTCQCGDCTFYKP